MDFSKLKPRERLMVILAGGLLPFFFFWILVLYPMLAEADRTYQEINTGQLKMQSARLARAARALRMPKFYPREEQLRRIVDFLEGEFRARGIKLITLQQGSADNNLSLDLSFVTTYSKLLEFLDQLQRSELVLVLDEIELNQSGEEIEVKMRLLSSYL